MTFVRTGFDDEMMLRACELARIPNLSRDINPSVGAVVVNLAGEVIGQGWHQGSGTDHAEVMALRDAGEYARGAVVYSTLEPCASRGKRGPCTDALIAAGVSRVVYGQSDPNEAMAGGGALLAEAGIEILSGIRATECAAMNASWTFAHNNGRPWVIWKTATTLDGFVAAQDGSSKWITGDLAREHVQKIRSQVGAIVTGTGTVLADDPSLTVKSLQAGNQPLRVIVGTRELPNTSNVFSDEAGTITFRADLVYVLEQLWIEHGIHKVLIEAGPGLSNAAWRNDVVDEVYWFIAPVLLGSGRSVVGDLGLDSLAQAHRFPDYELNRVGLDVVVHFTTRQGR